MRGQNVLTISQNGHQTAVAVRDIGRRLHRRKRGWRTCATGFGGAHEDLDDRGQRQIPVSARGPVRQICPRAWLASWCSCSRSTARWKPGSATAPPRPALTDAMSEKAQATSKRIEQSISDLERQISWVTRASADDARTAPRRLCATAQRRPRGQPALAAERPGPRIAAAVADLDPGLSGGADFSRDMRFTETVSRGVNYAPADFQGLAALSCRSRCRIPASTPGVTVADIDLAFSVRLPRRCPGRQEHLRLCDGLSRPGARHLGARAPTSALICRTLPQVAAMMSPRWPADRLRHRRVTGHSVLTAASAVREARLESCIFEQPTSQAVGADLGSAGADRVADRARPRGRYPGRHLDGAADADPDYGACAPVRVGSAPAISASALTSTLRTNWRNSPTSSTAWPGNSPKPIPASKPRSRERTRDLAQSINELKVLEEVGRAVSSSLDLNAVLPTVAARALEITRRRRSVLIYGYDAATGNRFKSGRGDRHRQDWRPAKHLAIDEGEQRARRGRHLRRADRDSLISPLRHRPSVARRRDRGRFSFGAGGAAGRPEGRTRIAGGVAQECRRLLVQPDRTDAHLRAPIGAGDAQRAAVH